MEESDSAIKRSSALSAATLTALTIFVGRWRELEDVVQLLARSRLATLTGTAGSCNIPLALRSATDTGSKYADGVYWVELGRTAGTAHIPQAMVKTLHVGDDPGRSLAERLLHALQDRQLLRVLDNCEHLLSACTQLAQTPLAATHVSILTTSPCSAT